MDEIQEKGYTKQCITRITEETRLQIDLLKEEWGIGEAQIIRAALNSYLPRIVRKINKSKKPVQSKP